MANVARSWADKEIKSIGANIVDLINSHEQTQDMSSAEKVQIGMAFFADPSLASEIEKPNADRRKLINTAIETVQYHEKIVDSPTSGQRLVHGSPEAWAVANNIAFSCSYGNDGAIFLVNLRQKNKENFNKELHSASFIRNWLENQFEHNQDRGYFYR